MWPSQLKGTNYFVISRDLISFQCFCFVFSKNNSFSRESRFAV